MQDYFEFDCQVKVLQCLHDLSSGWSGVVKVHAHLLEELELLGLLRETGCQQMVRVSLTKFILVIVGLWIWIVYVVVLFIVLLWLILISKVDFIIFQINI